MKLALKVNDIDNVAVVFADDIVAGDTVEVRDHKGNVLMLTTNDAIPYGHKIAVTEIKTGETVNKYGEVIGGATKDIMPGDYVHVHNMDSLRARGDLEGRES